MQLCCNRNLAFISTYMYAGRMYSQKQIFSPAHLLELETGVFSSIYPDMLSLTPYKWKHQTEKQESQSSNLNPNPKP